MLECDPGTRPELWQGAVRWTPAEDGWQPWRLLPEEEPYAYAPTLYETARAGAGVRFVADVIADRIEVEVTARTENPKEVDIRVDGELVLRQTAHGRHTAAAELPPGSHRVEVWLPQAGPVQVQRLRLPDGSTATPVAPRTRWITYGSSITQAASSAGPSDTWPAIVARNLDLDLTCLGFGGQCHLDRAAEATIAQAEVDVVSLCLGINIHGNGSFNERSLPGRLSAFIRAVRTAHPEVPIVVISPIISPNREHTENQAGLTLSRIREMVTEVTTDLQDAGDTRLQLVPGPEVFGAEDVSMLPDDLHPDAAGYRLMGERITPHLAAILPN